MRATLTALLAALVASGCLFTEDPPEQAPATPPTAPTREWPPLVFGGTVVDAITGAPAVARVQLSLAQTLPCGRPGIVWSQWHIPQDANGTYGPYEVPRPRSDDVAFFLDVRGEGYGDNVTFIGPAQARAGIGNMTVVLHPRASIEGSAPPGTLVALGHPGFPRIAVANETGRFAFADARAFPSPLVAAVDVPVRADVAAPAELDVEAAPERGWRLEGSVKGPTGAGIAADVVAYAEGALWSVARSSDTGAFAMPLPREPVDLRLEARTPDGRLGGAKALEVNGPPALRESILMRALC